MNTSKNEKSFYLFSLIKNLFKSIEVKNDEREFILKELTIEGSLGARFIFFSIISSSIAILGLLLNSPAVVIGAMLISPLMAPIVLQGFSIALLNINLFRTGTICLLLGAILGVGTAFIIVKLSPVINITTEIIARTSPNLFDLLVAIFSGASAGYVTVKRKGAAIVGVAIATSLMPPIAVVGFGLATANYWISKGAFLLFMTNFVAISLSVFFVSILYGFLSHREKKYLPIQLTLSFLILAILSIPLGISLKNIAYQSYVTNVTKKIIEGFLEGKHSRINDFSIKFKSDFIAVDAVVITKEYEPELKNKIKDQFTQSIGNNIRFQLTQIGLARNIEVPAFADNLHSKNNLTAASQKTIENEDTEEEIKKEIQKYTWLVTKSIRVDQNSGIITIIPEYDPNVSLQNIRDQEIKLSQHFSDWVLRIVPAHDFLPPIYFHTNESYLSEESLKTLGLIQWALERLQILKVDVIGFSSSNGNKKRNIILAKERAQSVASALEKMNFIVSVKNPVIRSGSHEKEAEKQKGYQTYQRVDVKPVMEGH